MKTSINPNKRYIKDLAYGLVVVCDDDWEANRVIEQLQQPEELKPDVMEDIQSVIGAEENNMLIDFEQFEAKKE